MHAASICIATIGLSLSPLPPSTTIGLRPRTPRHAQPVVLSELPRGSPFAEFYEDKNGLPRVDTNIVKRTEEKGKARLPSKLLGVGGAALMCFGAFTAGRQLPAQAEAPTITRPV